MYQWSLCRCDKHVIPDAWNPANISSLKSRPFDFYLMIIICAFTWSENMNQNERCWSFDQKGLEQMGVGLVWFIRVGWSDLIREGEAKLGDHM